MADPRFFKRGDPLTLGQLMELTGAELSDASAKLRQVIDVAPLQTAEPAHVSFLDNKKYASAFRETKAGACFVRPELVSFAPQGTVCLAHKNPYMAYALAAQAFYPVAPVEAYRAASAVVDATASIGQNCYIGHGVVIGAHAKIGDNCRIDAHAVIGEGVELGKGCDIGAHVVISHSLFGERVRVYPGACIGRAGFGFAMAAAGFVSVPQLGRVIVESFVEIGSNTTIDRGAGPDTVIGQGTRIDNLVQIGHNVKIGKCCVIVSQTGISGSTQLDDFVMTGGQSGFAGHLHIGKGARIGAQAGIMRDVDAGDEVMGSPAVPIRQFMRQVATLSKLSTKKGKQEE